VIWLQEMFSVKKIQKFASSTLSEKNKCCAYTTHYSGISDLSAQGNVLNVSGFFFTESGFVLPCHHSDLFLILTPLQTFQQTRSQATRFTVE